MENTKKEKLIKALEKERQNFIDNGRNTLEHDVAIEYLIKGYTKLNTEYFEILDAVVNDFDMVCSDYGIY